MQSTNDIFRIEYFSVSKSPVMPWLRSEKGVGEYNVGECNLQKFNQSCGRHVVRRLVLYVASNDVVNENVCCR